MGRAGSLSLFDFSGFAESSSHAHVFAQISASKTMGIALWSGLAILTVALLVIMRTRWGQAKPLSKCVVLSVFAHVLLMAYAYGTRLIFDAPSRPQEEVIRLAFVAEEGASTETPREKSAWNQYPADFSITPEIASPGQQEVQIEVESTPVDSQPPDNAVAESDSPEPTPLPEAPTAPAELVQSVPTPEPAIAPPLEQVAADELPEPSDDVADLTELPEPPQELATEQRIADIESPSELADARPDMIEMTAASRDDTSQPEDGDQRRVDDRVDRTQPLPNQPQSSNVVVAVPESRRVGDGEPLPDVYRLRVARNRTALIAQNGGNERTERSVEAALKWLAAHQEADGRWDASSHGAGRETKVLGHDRKGAGINADTGITGLALLAFLSAGNTHFEGEYRRNVQHGLEFILGKQATDGNLAGEAKLFARMYCHGMATLAICEGYAMTGDHRMRGYVENAVQYSINSQDQTTGSWRYLPSERGDMSQFGWQVMSLKSAELAGIRIPGETRSGMLRFLRSVSKGEHGGLASYRPTERPSETMTAEALACRFFLGIQQDDRAIREATSYLNQQLPGSGKANLYYWYYGTISLFQARSASRSPRYGASENAWIQWNQALQRQLLARQERVGDHAGSFSPDTVWGSYGGRVYSTALATLCLEVYYRYLPVYEQGPVAAAASRNVPQYRVLR